MIRTLYYYAAIASAIFSTFAAPIRAEEVPSDRSGKHASVQDAAQPRKLERSHAKDAEADKHTAKPVQDAAEPEHFRGQITAVQASSIVMKTGEGKTVRLGITDVVPIFSLSKGSFTDVDFGVYVGAAAVKLDEYSPIIRDSAVWLHKGFELRIIDEQLRGIALGEKKWDRTPDSVIAHGWVDDIEVRVLSIKWGPTDYDETDVEIPRDAPVIRMSLGDKSLIKPGAQVLAGAQKGEDGKYAAVFVFVGKDGIVPPL
ncbi:MAG: hypothetical protein M0Z99_21155 [Betaproteobacteria bacterium]|nr:hypothetical protein [Betaproteobacteria bacterium]